jgi:hypothetical protein
MPWIRAFPIFVLELVRHYRSVRILYIPIQEAQEVQKCRNRYYDSVQLPSNSRLLFLSPRELVCGPVAARDHSIFICEISVSAKEELSESSHQHTGDIVTLLRRIVVTSQSGFVRHDG